MKSLALRILALFAIALPLRAQTPESRSVTYLRTDGTPSLATVSNWTVSNSAGVLLIDSPTVRSANERFVASWQPSQCRTIESDFCDRAQSARVVVCASTSRRLRLAAAGVAIAANAPLVLGRDGEKIANRNLAEALIVGEEAREKTGAKRLADEAAALTAAIEFQSKRAPIDTIVLVNPADALSDLAPLALRGRNAALLMTNNNGDDAGAVIRRALKLPGLEHVENLLILGSPAAIPPERRENPLAGKDAAIEMEPGTPIGNEPCTLAIGRVFHADPGIVALTFARARLLPPDGSPRTALVASNPGGTLPMLETFSRTSARELHSCGYSTTSLIGDQLSAGQLRRNLPNADVFLWEGHHNTLIKDWGFATWSEPLRPSFMFLQSCLALTEDKASHLIERGAVAVVGSSSRIYSATGGAFSLAYLDAVLYDRQTLGGGLRSAKNFLLAYGQLKEKRLEQVKLGGANLRSAWAFTLWGDPSQRLPAPPPTEAASGSVTASVAGDTITLTVPSAAAESSRSGVYQAVYRPNARLAGLVRAGDDGEKKLVPLAFSEIALPQGPANAEPHLRTKLAESNWVFIWDARRRAGWLLVALPATAERQIRFSIDWKTHED
jgi:Peptidase family C25